ncbi:MAG: PLP-dependent aminotransferase family protein [Rhodobacteraceae bacterium]|nr:PLP-dependent aminotransferase family protein [Paracoccaceae bacterium]
MQASEIRELLKVIEQPGVISFAGGIPDPALFPRKAIAQAYSQILADPNRAAKALQYSVSEGDPALRAWIVGHMAGKGVACRPENILITSGSQQALEFLGKLFISPQDTALVAAPTYLGALQAFAPNEPAYDSLGFATTNRTADSYHEAATRAGGAVSFAYVVPDFANPTGETLTRAERLDLLELARDLDIPIVEDSPYSALRFDGDPMPTIQALDLASCGTIDASRVIHCGSFSKVFTPGLRVGWVCASSEIIEHLTLIKQASDLNSPAINQQVMLHLAQTLFDEQIAKTCERYRIKRDLMLAALERHMPEGTTWSRPEGGMFIWLTLPEGQDTVALLQKSIAQAGVAFVPGNAFFADKTGHNTMRLSFSLPKPEEIERGIAALASVLSGG